MWFSLISCRKIRMCKIFLLLITRASFLSFVRISQQLLQSTHPQETGFSGPVPTEWGTLQKSIEKPIAMAKAWGMLLCLCDQFCADLCGRGLLHPETSTIPTPQDSCFHTTDASWTVLNARGMLPEKLLPFRPLSMRNALQRRCP